MTLVVQTVTGLNPEAADAVQQIISGYGLRQQDASLSFGRDTFSYYSVAKGADAESVINDLMQLPDVVAAYVKPEGLPPM